MQQSEFRFYFNQIWSFRNFYKLFIGMAHQQKHSDDTQIFSGNDFGDKVAFTVGSSFCTGFLLGIGKGLSNGYPKSFKMPKKLIINNFFNSLGKETSRLGNAFAAAGLMYYFVGAALNLFLQDQFQQMTPLQKNMLCGGVSGILFKSTLGIVPACVGGILGTSLIGGLTLLVQEGNKKGFISFQMK